MAAKTAESNEYDTTKKASDENINKWSNISVSLPQLLDLALGTPEIGVVNFNILHNFLHALLQLTNLTTTQFEFRGEDAKRIETAITSTKLNPNIHLYEKESANVLQDEIQIEKKGIKNIDNPGIKEEIVINTNPGVKEKTITDTNPGIKEKTITDTNPGVKENIITDTNPGVKENILTDTNPGIKNKTITNTNPGVNENTIPNTNPGVKETIIINTNPGVKENTITDTNLNAETEMKTKDIIVNKTDNENDNEKELFKNNSIRDNLLSDLLHRIQDIEELWEYEGLVNDIKKLQEKTDKIETKLDNLLPITSAEIYENSQNESIQSCLSNIQTIRDLIENNVEARIQKLENDTFGMMNKLKNVAITEETEEKYTLSNEMIDRIQEIQGDIQKLNETTNRIIDDTENREENLNAMLEQIQYLQTIKADKEDLEDVLADKADTQTVNRKVSHEKFDAACNALTQSVQQALDNINQQNSTISNLFDEVQKKVEKKVDIKELTPIQNNVTNQLNVLENKIKQLIKVKSEIEAAGTKKVLSGVQCISCNENRVMRKEEKGRIEGRSMHCTRSIKPYLTYELDKIRKHQKTLPGDKDLNRFEAVMKDNLPKCKENQQADELLKNKVCTRYCGGIHTTTYSQRRAQRMARTVKNTDHLGKEETKSCMEAADTVIPISDPSKQSHEIRMYLSQSLPLEDVCTTKVRRLASGSQSSIKEIAREIRDTLSKSSESKPSQQVNGKRRFKHARISIR